MLVQRLALVQMMLGAAKFWWSLPESDKFSIDSL
jgi:hypothetical protein